MAISIATSTAPVASLARSITRPTVAVLNWLIAWDARWCQAQRMKQLTNEERRDMGLPLRIERPRLPDYGW
ncbi:hypothetical protein IMCC20628_01264 [Hoeflea sp. IMCC20628]|uniref:hypothetical protein n=1 Tax=Hoeflea sp. IMCC20628 TaxID=1620421 RepID=UPI00063AF77F|nr:hypothetical protein [Hoeflea sp. IMCC20628]AKH99980.1 hypothetical protein IMCC20628_01264 [Hoeflea sp. IMCC20628]